MLPGLGHLLKLLPVRGRSCSRHFATVGGVLKIFLDFFQT
jgi:hypothetical protein